jgi:subtilisin
MVMGLGGVLHAGVVGRLLLACCCGIALGALVLAVAASAASGATIPGHYIVVLKDSIGDPGAVAREHAREDGAEVSHVYSHALKGYAAAVPASGVAELQADPRVESVTPEHTWKIPDEHLRGQACSDPTACQVLDTSLHRIGADASSARSGSGHGSVRVNVAVIDSGVGPHPDLNVVGGTNCTSDGGTPNDVVGHGTFVAGIIGALDNGFGVVGVAPGARLWSVRVVDKDGFISGSDVLCGMDWITATRTDRDPRNDIAVANMSLADDSGGPEDGHCGYQNGDPFHQAICHSTAAGVTWVAVASNEGVDFRDTIPANYDEVLTATAMTDTDGKPGGLGPLDACDQLFADDTPPFFSDFAVLASDRAHTIAAPGVCLTSTVPAGIFGPGSPPYFSASGTSFSSPTIAGVAALCISRDDCRHLTPEQIIQKLRSDAAAYNQAHPSYGFTGDPLHSPDSSKYYGYLIRAGLY